jgi:hypothetical protein
VADVRRRIGLSLGADICWPLCYEELLRRLDLAIPVDGDTVRFDVQRVTIEPFRLRAPRRYDLVMDRLAHWYRTSREWVKKIVLMDDTYVFNNPWTFQSMEKQTSYCAMMRLGMPVPETWLVPPKEYEASPDLEPTLERYASLFDLEDVGEEVGYPLFMKPYDGGAWKGVSRIDDKDALANAYEASGRMIMHLQKAVDPYDVFVRCLGVGPQIRIMRYDPSAPMHDRYLVGEHGLSREDTSLLEDTTFTINSFFGWDFNSCELLRHAETGVWHPIDYANACPDSQVTSLHYHFAWLVLAKVRWSVFCAATGRPMRLDLGWKEFYDIAATGAPYREKLAAYAALGRERLEADRFAEFCDEHLSHLDEIADELFASDFTKEAVRKKVQAMYPEHEWDEFTDLFWGRVQDWRAESAPAKRGGGA